MIDANPYTAPQISVGRTGPERSGGPRRFGLLLQASLGFLLFIALIIGVSGAAGAMVGVSADFVSFELFRIDSGPSISVGPIDGRVLVVLGVGLIAVSLLAVAALLLAIRRMRG